MTQEILYSSDARRLLQELETATITSTNLPALKHPEQDALDDLYGQAVGLSKETEAPVKPKSPRMTNNELKAMKVATIKVDENPRFPRFPILEAIVRFSAQVLDVIKARKSKGAVTCQKKRS